MYQKFCVLQSDCSSDVAFCEFIDVVSLVELLGHYMNWEWTYKEAIPCLLKMLEGCVFEEYLAALFVLVGELGRIGVDAGGYKQTGISELRSHLTKLLGELTSKARSLPTQLAAVSALLNLLPSSFHDILSNRQDASLNSCESADAKHVQEWIRFGSAEDIMSLFSAWGLHIVGSLDFNLLVQDLSGQYFSEERLLLYVAF
ncbi:hypothetical protein HPP92_022551 [Vanilla planifolia]|uniref:Uncharacterized protein n=1 Tax=Vanilla planifolia TaxID=51239 RepID=A0A835PTJ9_VANPL|nr:hypothetical protein HPP92_022551 [Vanilla planifolia]